MTESLKMWRILSNKTNAFNKHVMQQKYLFDCTPRYVSSFKVHIFYALFFKRKGASNKRWNAMKPLKVCSACIVDLLQNVSNIRMCIF